MREERQLERVEAVLRDYKHHEPLSRYLKKYFSRHRNMGARDRRETKDLIFSFFRIGTNLAQRTFREKLAVANYLCGDSSGPLLDFLLRQHSVLNPLEVGLSPVEKLERINQEYPEFQWKNFFPLKSELSSAIEYRTFCLSMLRQPELWFRVREKYRELVSAELDRSGIRYSKDTETPGAYVCAQSTSLQNLEAFRKGYIEIQDRNSQRTKSYFMPRANEHWWDACAGSGGKSLLLLDAEPTVQLLASDVRESMQLNLSERISKAGFRNIKTEPINAAEDDLTDLGLFDGILADVPCSGSGTWARSPEWINFFNPDSLTEHFIPLQRKLISKMTACLKPGSALIYMTCSVFRKENEENIDYFQQTLPLVSEKTEYLSSPDYVTDTLFVSRLIKK